MKVRLRKVIEQVTLFVIKKQAEIGEFLLSFFMIVWGLWLLNPFWETFSLPSFAAFLMIADESVWGIVALLIGIGTLVSAGVKVYLARRIMIFLNIFWWTFVSTMFLIAVPENTAAPIYMMLAILSFWRYIKLILIVEMERKFFEKPENNRRLVER